MTYKNPMLKAVDDLERAEASTELKQLMDDEDTAVAMNAVATIVGRQRRQFFSPHDMKAARVIKAALQAIPSEATVLVQVADHADIAPSPKLDQIAAALDEPAAP